MRPLIPVSLIAGAAVLALALPASAETRTFNLANFTEISASAGVDVVLRQGPFSVVAEERNGKFDKLKLDVQGSTLVISRETNKGWSNLFGSTPDYTVTVTAPDLTAISASSGADVDGDNFRFANLSVSVSSGADVELSGQCTNLTVSVSSGADFDGEGLRCETATVTASSGGDADVYASRSASGNASSGGDVTVHGGGAITKNTSSGGSVKAS